MGSQVIEQPMQWSELFNNETTTKVSNIVKEAINVRKDDEVRAQNIIIYNIPEPTNEQENYDTNFVDRLLSEPLSLGEIKPINLMI